MEDKHRNKSFRDEQEITSHSTEPSRLKKGGGHKGGWIMGILLLCLIGAYLAVCAVAGGDRVLPNTTVAGVSVGGMSLSNVEAALSEIQAKQQEQSDAVLVFAADDGMGQVLTVEVPANYMELDPQASAERVWEESNGNVAFLEKGFYYLRALLSEQTISPIYVDKGNLDLLLAEDLDNRIGKMVEASTATVVDDTLQLSKGIPGREVDKEEVKEKLMELLAKGETVKQGTKAPQFTVSLVESLPKELDLYAVHDEICVEPSDASVDEETGEFNMEVVGVYFDVSEAQILFNGLDWGEQGSVPLIRTEPEVKLTDLDGYLFQDVLGACTTNIGGTSNRLSNVKLAASLCNGIILSPGEDFSYNGTVGHRTSGRGFLPAPAYVAGKTVNEIGGGICQVSSSIYLASLRANMTILERYNHRYTVGYVPNGLDATVYYGSLDYGFKNTTKYPIKLVTSVSGRTLTVTIYGTNEDQISVKMETVQTGKKSYKTVYKIDNSIAVGTTKTEVTPYTGRTVKAYRCIYQNGTLVSRTLESTNDYKSRDKVVLINEADAKKYGLEVPASSVPSIEEEETEPTTETTTQPTTEPTQTPESEASTDPEVTPESESTEGSDEEATDSTTTAETEEPEQTSATEEAPESESSEASDDATNPETTAEETEQQPAQSEDESNKDPDEASTEEQGEAQMVLNDSEEEQA